MKSDKENINPLDKPIFVYLPLLVAFVFGLITLIYFIVKTIL